MIMSVQVLHKLAQLSHWCQ